MKIVRYHFFFIDDNKGHKTKKSLGFKDVVTLGKILPDGCSNLAKAFRNCTVEQKSANCVEIEFI